MSLIEFLATLRRLDIQLWFEDSQLCYSAPPGALTPELRAELVARKAEIRTFLREAQSATRGSVAAMTPPARPDDLPLSFAQQRLWLLDQLEPGNPSYNISASIRFTGQLDLDALRYSLNAIVQRHEVLRTTFVLRASEPVQVIAPPALLPIAAIDLRALPADTRAAEVQRHAESDARQPFDLARGPLVRISLLRLGEAEHVLLLTVHHIVFDGWSMRVFFQEFVACYTAACAGTRATLPEPPMQYADFALWQRAWLRGEQLESHLAYWRQHLGRDLAALELPSDRPRSAVRTYRGARQSLALASSLSQALHILGRQEDATLFMVLLAAFKILLARHTARTDMVVGTPIAGRNRAEIEGLIGCFVNNLVLHTDLSGTPSFREALRRVREVCLGAYAHQEVPFELLLEALHPERDLSRTPLFQVFVNMLNIPDSRFELPGLTIDLNAPLDIGAKFDLTLYIRDEGAVQFDLVYNADLFEPARMAELLDQLRLLLEQAVERPDEPIDGFSLVTPAARGVLPNPAEPLRSEWEGAIHEHFARQARRIPDRAAVIDQAGTWSYRALDARGNQLAYHLRRQGVGAGDVVAIYTDRSAGLVAALLGVLKAGAAFMILDSNYPAARLIDYLALAKPRALIRLAAAGPLPDALEAYVANLAGCPCLALPGTPAPPADDPLAGCPDADLGVAVDPDGLAYIAVTSGTTGAPKGIRGTHRPLAHFLQWHTRTFGLQETDRFSMLSGLAHDPLLRDIFTPLWLGATLCVPAPGDFAAGRLTEWMRAAAISVVHLTPGLSQLLTSGPSGIMLPQLRLAFFGGDVLTRHHIERLHELAPSASGVNFYGTTETPQAMSYFKVPAPAEPAADGGASAGGDAVPIGRGIEGAQLLLLNAARQLAGIGEIAEIYVRSPYLARGYLGDAALTQERFIDFGFTPTGYPILDFGLPGLIQNPKSKIQNWLYKTGDLGRYRADGNVEFLGRADQQVKIRGFRVEPSAVEAALKQHPGVREAVVVAREDAPGEKRLIAYIVPTIDHRPPTTVEADKETRRQGDSSDTNLPFSPSPLLPVSESSVVGELRDFLKERLPAYMVPASFIELEALPLTPNGKIDRKALPILDGARPELELAYVAPQSDVEREIATIWCSLLHVDKVGIDDNFFDLGGHSLLVVRAAGMLREALQRDISIVELFKYPTIRLLARHLSQPREEQAHDRAERPRAGRESTELRRQLMQERKQFRQQNRMPPRAARIKEETH